MDLSFLPDQLQKSIQKVGLDKIYEIKIKRQEKTVINVKNNYILSEFVDGKEFDEIIKKCTEYSLYAFSDQIINGYITTKQGIRIGIGGKCNSENGRVISFTEIDSLNIRIPTECQKIDKRILDNLFDSGRIKNAIIISEVGMGKTTLLKSLAVYIENHVKKPILIADERGEFLSVKGSFIDRITYASKEFCFNKGIRSLSPYALIFDEIVDKEDFSAVYKAYLSGVKVVTSIHSDSIEKLRKKEGFINMFDLYIKLKNEGEAGVLDKLYDFEFKEIV